MTPDLEKILNEILELIESGRIGLAHNLLKQLLNSNNTFDISKHINFLEKA